MTMTIGTIRTHQSTVPSPDKSNLIGSAHSVQFYGDDTFLVDDISRFIGASLGAGRAAVVIATGEHLRGFALRLKARGVDSDLARTQGRYICLDAADTLSRFMVDGRPDPERFLGVIGGVLACAIAAASGEQPRVAAFGEMVALLWADGNHAAAIELEELWNDLGRKYCFDLRCAYPMSFF